MDQPNSASSGVDELRGEVAELRSELTELTGLRAELRAELATIRHDLSRQRHRRRPNLRSILVVGLLLALASAGGIGYASVAVVVPSVTAPAGAYQAVTPVRILDTLNGTGAPKAAVASFGVVNLAVAGIGVVPPDATAVVINVTVAEGTQAGNIGVYPDGTPAPFASNVNFLPGQTIPNLVVVKVGGDGKVNFLNRSSGTVQLIADLAGYYAPGSTNTLVVPSDGTAAENGFALQAAVGSLSGSTETVVQLEPGVYTLPTTIDVPANTWIEGAGKTATILTSNVTDGSGVALFFTSATGNNGLTNLGMVVASNDNLALDENGGLQVDSLDIQTASPEYGIDVESGTTVSITDTTINETGTQGVPIAVSGGSVTVQGSTLTSAGYEAVFVYSGSAAVRGSALSTTGTQGVVGIEAGNLDIADSQVVGSTHNSGGTFVCVGDYNAAYAPLGSACT